MPTPGPFKPHKPVDRVEEEFWDTPGAKALRFTDYRLLDEEAEFGDISMASSIASPTPAPPVFARHRSMSPPSPTPGSPEDISTQDPPIIIDEEPSSFTQELKKDSKSVTDAPHNTGSHQEMKFRVTMDMERAVVSPNHAPKILLIRRVGQNLEYSW